MNTTAITTGLWMTAVALLFAAGTTGAASMEDGPAMDGQGMEKQNDTMEHDDGMMKDDDAMMDKEKDDGDDHPLPGFAAIAALVALGAAAWLARRRN